MNELQKEYMIDALSELDDRYIAEAAAYKPPKGRWKFFREIGVVAACLATLVITAAVWQYLPIGNFTAKDAMKPESAEWTGNSNMKQEAAMEEMVTVPESTQDSMTNEDGTKYEGLEEEGSAAEGNVGSGNTAEKDTLENVQNSIGKKAESQNITWKLLYEHTNAPENYYSYITENITEEIDNNNPESAVDGTISNGSTGFTDVFTKEMLDQNRDIFRGTVTKKQVYQVTEGLSAYFTVLTVEVTDAICGELSVGDSCRIYLPVARAENGTQIQDTCAAGDMLMLSLEVGSDAVFLPEHVTEESGRGNEKAWLSYSDFADYYFEDGIYTIFLEMEDDQIAYAKDMNRLNVENKKSLEDVMTHLRKLLTE